MASTCGRHDPDLAQETVERRLKDAPFTFDFFQAVCLLIRSACREGRAETGTYTQDEVVRFRANPALAFPASEIQSLTYRQGKPPLMAVNFMGLTGPLGSLPLVYREFVLDRIRVGDEALRDFIDIFNHRMIALFYGAWRRNHFVVDYKQGKEDSVSQHVLELLGLGTTGLRDRAEVPYDVLTYYAGLVTQSPRSACALRQTLRDYFDVPVEIKQFAGAWYALTPSSRCVLEDGDTAAEQLGSSTVMGDEVWNPQSRVRIKLGPLTLAQFMDFLPSGEAYTRLRSIVKFFSNDELDFELQLTLERDQIPSWKLDYQHEDDLRLGWTTWLAPSRARPGAAGTIVAV